MAIPVGMVNVPGGMPGQTYSGGGSIGQTASGSPLRTARNDAAAKAYIYDNFGVLSGFLNDPEIGPLLMQAGYEGWDMTRLQTRLYGTNWWRQHSDAERNYRMAEQTDPATLGRTVAEKQAGIYDLARQFGIGDVDLGEIARNAVMYGWSDTQVRDILSAHIDAGALSSANTVHTLVDKARATAGDYFVHTTDDEAISLARRVMAGEMNPEDMTSVYKDRAKQLYSYLAPTLDQGVTMKQYFEPHRQELAKLLEVNPDSIDFQNDSRYSKIMQVQDPDGKVRAMNLTEVADFARKQPEWAHTQNAQDGAADMATKMAQLFGAM